MKNKSIFIITDKNHQYIHVSAGYNCLNDKLYFLQKGNPIELECFCTLTHKNSYFYKQFFDLCFHDYRKIEDWFELSCECECIKEFILLLNNIRIKNKFDITIYDELLNFYNKYNKRTPYELLDIINKYDIINRNILYKRKLE